MSSWQEAWPHVDIHSTGGIAESSLSRSTGSIERHWEYWDYLEILKTQSPPQWHTSSNKATPILKSHTQAFSRNSTPCWPSIQIYEPVGAILSHNTTHVKKSQESNFWFYCYCLHAIKWKLTRKHSWPPYWKLLWWRIFGNWSYWPHVKNNFFLSGVRAVSLGVLAYFVATWSWYVFIWFLFM